MAAKKKKTVMVLHEEGATAPMAAPVAAAPPALFVVLKPGQASEASNGGQDKGNEKAVGVDKTGPTIPSIKSTAKSINQLENLAPEKTCKSIKFLLDNNNMWNEFFRCKTEMILTNQGCRMFPYCRFRISGLEPFQNYSLVMDIQPVDKNRYKWNGQDWQTNGKAEKHAPGRVFIHPESPSSGHYWMQNPVSFYKLKLTNNAADQEGNVILHSLHRYLPRLHVVQSDKATQAIQLKGPDVITVTFPQTEFFAVTAYQNSRFTQLKVDYNPFAKGFREDGPSSWALKLKQNPSNDSKKDEGKSSKELNPMKKSLKSLMAKRSTKVVGQGSLSTAAPNATFNGPDVKSSVSPAKSNSTEQNSCKTSPPRNFSELIRESHVKLRRCLLTGKAELADDDSMAGKGKAEEPVKDNIAQPGALSSKDVQKVAAHNKGRPIELVKTSPKSAAESENSRKAFHSSSMGSEPQGDKGEGEGTTTKEKAKPHKRPGPVPLNALALYLQQLKAKSSSVGIKPKSPQVLPPATSSPSPSHVPGPASDQATEHIGQTSGPVTDPAGPAVGVAINPAHQPDTDPAVPTIDHLVTNADAPVPATQSLVPDTDISLPEPDPVVPAIGTACATTDQSVPSSDAPVSAPEASVSTTDRLLPEPQPMLPIIDQSLLNHEPSLSPPTPLLPSTVMSSMLPGSLLLSPSLSSQVKEQPPHVPVTLDFTAGPSFPTLSSSLSSATLKPASTPLLQSTEPLLCGLEPLSPASLPDPEPSLPSPNTLEPTHTSLLLEKTPATLPIPASSLKALERLPTEASVFIPSLSAPIPVIPAPDPFLTTAFTPFSLASHFAPFSLTPRPALSLSLSQPGPHTLETGLSSPPTDLAASFQVNDQSLPTLPSTPSPLSIPLALSPSFSSLGTDPLSPTPSLSDLVNFFSINNDLDLDEHFPSSEVDPELFPPSLETSSIQSSGSTRPTRSSRPQKSKIKSRKGKSTKTDDVPFVGGPIDVHMHPNLEEVEEQLFVSFTSKEALQIHLGDPVLKGVTAQPPLTPETTKNVEGPETQEEIIAAFEEVLLRDLKHMKHQQVIHPVLQEVGLKLNLLDPTLTIDLQYLGVCLPLTSPFQSPEEGSSGLEPSPSGSVPFVSRTGKTTDVTQIKGWREKFVPEDSPPSTSKLEVGPSADVVTKNLSAFCSDMLDEYLANEGKLIDERAASFSSQTVITPVVYELPIKSTSYVRTLDSVLKKQTPASMSTFPIDFIPPSKRAKLPSFGPKKSRKSEKRPKDSKTETTTAPTPVPAVQPTAASKPLPPTTPVATVVTAPITPSNEKTVQKKKKKNPKPPQIETIDLSLSAPPLDTWADVYNPVAPIIPNTENTIKKKKTKSKSLQPQTQYSSVSEPLSTPMVDHTVPVTNSTTNNNIKKKRKTLRSSHSQDSVSADMAPLESDSELLPTTAEPRPTPVVTKALLKQRDLENGVVWEGQHRTCISKERAAIALTSLFTLWGFVSENPTAPVQVIKRRAPPCLNDFCRLGCVCSSLRKERRITHCGKQDCIFGCSCLRQKVVLLKNLDGPDSSTSEEGSSKKKRKRRMRMAYTLKETETVSEPALRVRTLWKQKDGELDPEPMHIPTPVYLPYPPPAPDGPTGSTQQPPQLVRERDEGMTCARVRAFQNKKVNQSDLTRQKDNDEQSKAIESTPDLVSYPKMSLDKSSPDPQPSTALVEPSKRLEIVSECKWKNRVDRNYVLRVVCEHMAQDNLTNPFRVKGYMIKPLSQIMRSDGESCYVHYKVHISQAKPGEREEEVGQEEEAGDEEGGGRVEETGLEEEEGVEDWQKEIEEEEEEQREEDKEVRPSEEEVKKSREDMDEEKKKMEQRVFKKKRELLALPYLAGISPAGILIANKKGQDVSIQELVQVNGKSYPQAKLQLGQMGALHPANRLAAYVTGRLRTASEELAHMASSKATPTTSVATAVTAASTPTVTTTVTTLENVFKDFVADQIASKLLKIPSTQSVGTVQKTAVAPPAFLVVQGPGVSQRRQKLRVGSETRSGQVRVVSTAFPGTEPLPQGTGSASALVSAATVGSISPSVSSSKTGGKASTLSPLMSSPPGNLITRPPMLMIPVPGTSTAVGMPCLPSQPLAPLTPGQRMVLQPVPSTTGTTLYRNPNGQLIQLVPLSQLRALNPNLVMTKSGTISLTSPLCTAPGPTTNSPSTFKTRGDPAFTSTTTVHASHTTTPTPPKVTPLQRTKTFVFSSLGSTLQPCPTSTLTPRMTPTPTHGLLGEKGTCSVRVVPSTGSRKTPNIITTMSPQVSTQGPSKVMVKFGSFTPLWPQKTLDKSPLVHQGTDTGVKAVSVSTVGSSSNTDPKAPTSRSDFSSTAGGLTKVLPYEQASFRASALSISSGTQTAPGTSSKSPVPFQAALAGPGTRGAKQPSDLTTLPSPIQNTKAPLAVESNPDVMDLELVCLGETSGPSVQGVEEVQRARHRGVSVMRASQTEVEEEDVVDLMEDTEEEEEEEETTDNSSDETEEEEKDDVGENVVDSLIKLHLHKVQEKGRRGQMSQRFLRLKNELELEDLGATKVSILSEAKEEIKVLTEKQNQLKKEERSLAKNIASNIKLISQASGLTQDRIIQNINYISSKQKREAQNKVNHGSQASSSVSRQTRPQLPQPQRATEGVQSDGAMGGAAERSSLAPEAVVNLLYDTEEETDNSSDDDDANYVDVISILSEETVSAEEEKDEGMEEEEAEDAVDIETVDDEESMNNALDMNLHTSSADRHSQPKPNRAVLHNKLERVRRAELMERFDTLRETLDLRPSHSKRHLLSQAKEEISVLSDKCVQLEKLKASLDQQRAAHIKKIAQTSGKSEEGILRKLRDICSRQQEMEEQRNMKYRGSKAPSSPVSRRRAHPAPSQSTQQAGPKPVSKPPQLSPLIHTKAPPPPPAPRSSGSDPQAKARTLLQSPRKPQDTPWSRPYKDRPRTHPNILSRRKPLPSSPAVDDSTLFHPTMIPSQMLSVVSLTGLGLQPSNTPGVASVTINIPSMSQGIQVNSPSLSLSDPAPNIPTVLSLVAAPQPPAEPQTSGAPLPAPSGQGKGPLATPRQGAGAGLEDGEVPLGEPLDNSPDCEDDDDDTDDNSSQEEEDGEDESLSSLLNEIVFLNQQIISDCNREPALPSRLTGETGEGEMETAGEIRDRDDERSLSPLFLKLDEDLVGTRENSQAEASKDLQQQQKQMQDSKVSFGTDLQPAETGSTSPPAINGHSLQSPQCTVKGGALTPPPLMQMKVGGVAKMVDSPSERPQEKEGGVVWRPMPRLAPLGLKNNPQT